MSSIFVTLTVSILLVFESLGDQFPESMHIYARCTLPFTALQRGPLVAVLCFLPTLQLTQQQQL